MRTTLRINDQVLAEAKKLAIDTGQTLTQIVEDLLRAAVGRKNQKTKQKLVKLHTIGYSKLRPDVDFSDNSALQDLMDD